MSLAVLSIDIVARLASLEEGMRKATGIAEKNAADIEARYQKVGDTVKSVSKFIAGAFAGYSLVSFVRNTAHGIDALNDLKDATGSSIENISALEDVALKTGTSFESMASTLVKFNKVLSEATPGSETENILKSIGLDAKKLRDEDPSEALRQTAVALAGYADDGNKARIIQELFAKSIREAAPLLNDLAKQTKLTATVTTQQAEAAERFNNQLAELQKHSLDTARALFGSLVPALNSVLESYLKLGGLTGTLKAIFGQDEISQARRRADFLTDHIQQVGDSIARMTEEFNRKGDGSGKDFLGVRIAKAREKLAALVKESTAASDDLQRLAQNFDPQKIPFNDRRDGSPKPRAPGPPSKATAKKEEIDDATRALGQYVAQLDRERESVQELSDEQKALNFLKSLGTLGQIPQVRELVLGLAEQNDVLRDQAALKKLNAEADKEIERQRVESQRAVNSLIESTPTEKTAQFVKLQADLNAWFEKNADKGKQYAEALAVIREEMIQLDPAAKKAREESMALGKTIEDTLGSSVLSALKGNFGDILQLWGNMIEQMIAKALTAKLSEALLGDFAKTGNIGGGIGSLLALFGFANGGAFGAGGVQAFARGDVIGSPTLFKFAGGTGLMGEAGPEAIMPLRRGRDGKLGVSGDGGGGTTVINVAAGMTRNEVLTALQFAANAIRAEFNQKLRAAGVA